MAERKGDQPQVEDIKCDTHDIDGIGEDFPDSYPDTSGYIYVLRKRDHTGHPKDDYKIEVKPERYTGSRDKLLKQLLEMPVTNRRNAERDLREAFGYVDHRSTEDGWFPADSQEEVESKSREILKKWSNMVAE
jgi:hypothetical protein